MRLLRMCHDVAPLVALVGSLVVADQARQVLEARQGELARQRYEAATLAQKRQPLPPITVCPIITDWELFWATSGLAPDAAGLSEAERQTRTRMELLPDLLARKGFTESENCVWDIGRIRFGDLATLVGTSPDSFQFPPS